MFPIYYPYPYHYFYPYRYPYAYPYSRAFIGSQVSSINQQLFNAGIMAGVTQSAISNNIMF